MPETSSIPDIQAALRQAREILYYEEAGVDAFSPPEYRLARALLRLEEQLEAWENGLARAYHDHREYQTAIATLCDLYLDPRGGLLGRVRAGPVSNPASSPEERKWQERRQRAWEDAGCPPHSNQDPAPVEPDPAKRPPLRRISDEEILRLWRNGELRVVSAEGAPVPPVEPDPAKRPS